MCNLRRAKPSTSRASADEERQPPYPYTLHPLQQQHHPQDNVQAALDTRRLPRSTGSTGGRDSFGGSIRSYGTDLNLRPGESPSAIAIGASDEGGGIEALPTELLEAIFLLAIQTSFPIEDPNWPLSPMFSKRSYRHSPSTSSSGYAQDGLVPRTPTSATRAQFLTPALLTSAPHLLPTVLSQTCRRFRSVLRHAPHLWSYIHITRALSHQTQPPLLARQMLGWVPIYLARARESPLHITFDTTKFASFSAPLSHSNAAVPPGTVVHPQSILGLLHPTIPRWASVTVLTSHIGSATLAPLLELMSPLAVPRLARFRIAADIWRPGIVGYGSSVPRLFVGGNPKLDSVVLEGVPLDWKSCAGVGIEPGAGLFNSIKNLELRFIAGRYPRWEQFAILLEDGCPQLERLVVRDDFDEVLRTLSPPPLPHFEEHAGLSMQSVEGNSSTSGRTSSTASTMTRVQSHLANLHITVPPATSHGDRGRGIGRSLSTSSSSSESSSGSSSPTSPYHPRQGGHRRRRAREREFRKIHLPGLKHLEVQAFNLSGSRSNLALQSHSSSLADSTSTSKVHNPTQVPPPSVARFLYLFSTPSIHSLRLSRLSREEWVVVAGMLGLPVDAPQRTKGKWVKAGTPPRAGATRTFPFLTTLAVELVDA